MKYATDYGCGEIAVLAEDAGRKVAPRSAEEGPDADQWRREVLRSHDLLGVMVPPEYGGRGWGWLEACVALSTLAKHCPRSSTIYTRYGTGGPAFIAQVGSEAHKSTLLPGCVAGTTEIGVAFTEPDAGSAMSDLTTTARQVSDGSWRLDGHKTFQSSAKGTALVTVARFENDEGSNIGMALTFPGREGFTVTNEEVDMAGTSHYDIVFDGYNMPETDILTKTRGMSDSLGIYNGQRLGKCARALGLAQGALDYAVNWLKERYQFGRPVEEFQGLRWMVADAEMKLRAAEHFLLHAARSDSQGRPDRHATSMADVTVTENAKKVCDTAIQLIGGYGYLQSNGLEHRYRMVRGTSIYGGTTQIHRNMIADHIFGDSISQRTGHLR
jgi:alkylation response protein AidB-like acyl-CoA dehydrogenase